jgi:hypothetical protein
MFNLVSFESMLFEKETNEPCERQAETLTGA